MKQNMMRVVVVEILRRLFIVPRKELYIVRAVSPLYRKEATERIMFNERNSQFVRSISPSYESPLGEGTRSRINPQ